MDIGFKSHILIYCSDMAEQNTPHTVQRAHAHMTQHTCGYMERQTKGSFVAHTPPNAVMIDIERSF